MTIRRVGTVGALGALVACHGGAAQVAEGPIPPDPTATNPDEPTVTEVTVAATTAPPDRAPVEVQAFTPTPVTTWPDTPNAASDDVWWRSQPGYTATLPPDYIRQCESGGDYSAVNSSSGAGGGWQIMPGTWNGYEGYARAEDAPPHIQDAKAAELWSNGAGSWHWSQCL